MNPIDDTPKGAPPLPADDPRSPENIARRKALQIAERDEKGRLLPGSRIAGAGRKPDAENITALARVHTQRALEVLREVIDDPKAPHAARVASAQALIDRGWGKAPVTIDLNVRAKFDSFLREVGAAATYEHDHPALQAVQPDSESSDEVMDVSICGGDN